METELTIAQTLTTIRVDIIWILENAEMPLSFDEIFENKTIDGITKFGFKYALSQLQAMNRIEFSNDKYVLKQEL